MNTPDGMILVKLSYDSDDNSYVIDNYGIKYKYSNDDILDAVNDLGLSYSGEPDYNKILDIVKRKGDTWVSVDSDQINAAGAPLPFKVGNLPLVDFDDPQIALYGAQAGDTAYGILLDTENNNCTVIMEDESIKRFRQVDSLKEASDIVESCIYGFMSDELMNNKYTAMYKSDDGELKTLDQWLKSLGMYQDMDEATQGISGGGHMDSIDLISTVPEIKVRSYNDDLEENTDMSTIINDNKDSFKDSDILRTTTVNSLKQGDEFVLLDTSSETEIKELVDKVKSDDNDTMYSDLAVRSGSTKRYDIIKWVPNDNRVLLVGHNDITTSTIPESDYRFDPAELSVGDVFYTKDEQDVAKEVLSIDTGTDTYYSEGTVYYFIKYKIKESSLKAEVGTEDEVVISSLDRICIPINEFYNVYKLSGTEAEARDGKSEMTYDEIVAHNKDVDYPEGRAFVTTDPDEDSTGIRVTIDGKKVASTNISGIKGINDAPEVKDAITEDIDDKDNYSNKVEYLFNSDNPVTLVDYSDIRRATKDNLEVLDKNGHKIHNHDLMSKQLDDTRVIMTVNDKKSYDKVIKLANRYGERVDNK